MTEELEGAEMAELDAELTSEIEDKTLGEVSYTAEDRVYGAGHPNPRIWYSDHYPLPKSKRLTYKEAALVLLNNGWPRDKKILTTAVAVMNAESARDHRAYLAYIDLGVDRNSAKGLELRAKIDALPASTTLVTLRQKVKAMGLKVVRADIGLFQIGRPPHLDLTVQELTDPNANAKRALKLYRDNGNTFNPWAAYTTPRGPGQDEPYKWYMDEAEEAVNEVLY